MRRLIPEHARLGPPDVRGSADWVDAEVFFRAVQGSPASTLQIPLNHGLPAWPTLRATP